MSTEQKLDSLITSIEQGDAQSTLNLINENNIDINDVLDNGFTPFEHCLNLGYVSLAKELYSLPSFDVNCQTHNPHMFAVVLGYTEIVIELINKGAKPNIYGKNHRSLLLICLERGCFDIAEILINKGAEVNSRDSKGWTPLIYASYTGKKEIVEFLLNHNALVNI